jgi:hypothetical protein
MLHPDMVLGSQRLLVGSVLSVTERRSPGFRIQEWMRPRRLLADSIKGGKSRGGRHKLPLHVDTLERQRRCRPGCCRSHDDSGSRVHGNRIWSGRIQPAGPIVLRFIHMPIFSNRPPQEIVSRYREPLHSAVMRAIPYIYPPAVHGNSFKKARAGCATSLTTCMNLTCWPE